MFSPAPTVGPCPFCRYALGDDTPPGGFIYRDAGVMVFEPLHPFVPGHRLVVPDEHVADIRWASPELVGQVMWTVGTSVARMVSGGADGANIVTSVGEAATQTVPHWHVHIVPRREADALRGWPWYPNPTEENH